MSKDVFVKSKPARLKKNRSLSNFGTHYKLIISLANRCKLQYQLTVNDRAGDAALISNLYLGGAALISKQLKHKTREYRGSNCERIKYWLTFTLLNKIYKRRDKSNLNQDLGAIQPTLNTIKVANWLFTLLSNVLMQLYLFILHTETWI